MRVRLVDLLYRPSINKTKQLMVEFSTLSISRESKQYLGNRLLIFDRNEVYGSFPVGVN